MIMSHLCLHLSIMLHVCYDLCFHEVTCSNLCFSYVIMFVYLLPCWYVCGYMNFIFVMSFSIFVFRIRF